jgi:hypothetical protein
MRAPGSVQRSVHVGRLAPVLHLGCPFPSVPALKGVMMRVMRLVSGLWRL